MLDCAVLAKLIFKEIAMNVYEIITQEFEEEILRQFCAMHAEIAEDEDVRHACTVLLKYVSIPE